MALAHHLKEYILLFEAHRHIANFINDYQAVGIHCPVKDCSQPAQALRSLQ
jgi:hypothetical protein